MTRFYFDLHECGSDTIDLEGRELESLHLANDLAVRSAREIMCGELSEGKLCLACYIDIRTADDHLSRVMFYDAVHITGMKTANL